jgi:hypothetical protein
MAIADWLKNFNPAYFGLDLEAEDLLNLGFGTLALEPVVAATINLLDQSVRIPLRYYSLASET